MEESMTFLETVRTYFPSNNIDIKTYSPLNLAYIGDTVYDLIIRTKLLDLGNRPVQELHSRSSKYVKATSQAAVVTALLDAKKLNEEELSIYRRGRNAKSYTKAKNADSGEYSRATGLEAVIGYLYLKDEMERALELVEMGLKLWEESPKKD